MHFSFNLIDQPWIPVVDLNGKPSLVGLREALAGAHNYRQLGASPPHANAALYRLLLAILHDANQGPRDDLAWQQVWQAQAFDPGRLEDYWSLWHDHFDLFSETCPFYQSRHPDVEVKPANALLFLVAGGDPDTLFDHSTDDRPLTLSPARAALILVTVQSFGLAGLCHPQKKLVYTDAPCSRAIVFLIQGNNLFESLMLNWVRYTRATPVEWAAHKSDSPAWRVADPYETRSLPNGYLDYLTWQNRKIMLFPSLQDGQVVVREVTTAPGLVLAAEQLNPMHHYRLDKDNGRKVVRFQEGRALWRDSSALLNLRGGQENLKALLWVKSLIGNEYLPHRRLQLAAYGMSTEPGKAKVYFYRGEQFEFSVALLRDPEASRRLDQALDLAEALRRQLWGALHSLADLMFSQESDLADGRKPAPDDAKNLMAHWDTESQYWNRLELPFYHFLDHLPGDPQGALEEWKQELRQAVLKAFDLTATLCGTSTRALKAAAKGRIQMRAGAKSVLEPVVKEG